MHLAANCHADRGPNCPITDDLAREPGEGEPPLLGSNPLTGNSRPGQAPSVARTALLEAINRCTSTAAVVRRAASYCRDTLARPFAAKRRSTGNTDAFTLRFAEGRLSSRTAVVVPSDSLLGRTRLDPAFNWLPSNLPPSVALVQARHRIAPP